MAKEDFWAGQDIFVAPERNRQGSTGYWSKVAKIGREYVTLSNGARFGLDWALGRIIFSSEAQYAERIAFEKDYHKFSFQVMHRLRDGVSALDLAEAKRLLKIPT